MKLGSVVLALALMVGSTNVSTAPPTRRPLLPAPHPSLAQSPYLTCLHALWYLWFRQAFAPRASVASSRWTPAYSAVAEKPAEAVESAPADIPADAVPRFRKGRSRCDGAAGPVHSPLPSPSSHSYRLPLLSPSQA